MIETATGVACLSVGFAMMLAAYDIGMSTLMTSIQSAGIAQRSSDF